MPPVIKQQLRPTPTKSVKKLSTLNLADQRLLHTVEMVTLVVDVVGWTNVAVVDLNKVVLETNLEATLVEQTVDVEMPMDQEEVVVEPLKQLKCKYQQKHLKS